LDLIFAAVSSRRGAELSILRTDVEILERIEQRVLWLASVVSIMTALYSGHLRREDRVSVKPHAAPVGSVGIGATATILAALAHRYVSQHFEHFGLDADAIVGSAWDLIDEVGAG
jgi:hypothetical protein